jgi:hypothetical protein
MLRSPTVDNSSSDLAGTAASPEVLLVPHSVPEWTTNNLALARLTWRNPSHTVSAAPIHGHILGFLAHTYFVVKAVGMGFILNAHNLIYTSHFEFHKKKPCGLR